MGAAPKPAALRQRRNRTTTAATIAAAPAAKVPLPDGYHRNTIATWDVWWSSPLVDEWVDADVPGLLELAQLVEDFWTTDDPKVRKELRGEIRLSSKEYGLSPLSRRSLQWEIRRLAKPVVSEAPRRPVSDPRLRVLG